jgi:hypothetical protein
MQTQVAWKIIKKQYLPINNLNIIIKNKTPYITIRLFNLEI